MTKFVYLAWGAGEPCPWCGKKVPLSEMSDHAAEHLKKGDIRGVKK